MSLKATPEMIEQAKNQIKIFFQNLEAIEKHEDIEIQNIYEECKNYIKDLKDRETELDNDNVSNTYANHLKNTLNTINDFFSKNTQYTKQLENMEYIQHQSTEFKASLSRLDIFDIIKNIQKNAVMIGANGAGKSRYARQLLQYSMVIPAERNLYLESDLNVINRIDEDMIQGLFDRYQKAPKLENKSIDNTSYNKIYYPMILLLQYLINDKRITALNHYSNDISQPKPTNKLDSILKLYTKLIPHINISINAENRSINISKDDNVEIKFNSLSTGEREILYCIGHVLSAPKNSYIVVDEPEVHLNVAILSKLWNLLESERSDCQFVYMTHSKDFALSRKNKEFIWIKKFNADNTWDYEKIGDSFEDFPEGLIMELVGAKQNILFCEGEKSSLDYQLYSILFSPYYHIIPVGSCDEVIKFCKAYNKNQELKKDYNAIGIIDRDYRDEKDLKELEKDKIYHLPSCIEQLLIDEEILKEVNDFYSLNNMEHAKSKFFEELKNNKTKEIEYCIKQQLTHTMNTMPEGQDIIAVINKIEAQCTKAKETLKSPTNDKFVKEIDDIINKKDYKKALTTIQNKKYLYEVGNTIITDYKKIVFTHIEKSERLKEYLLKEYFSKIQLTQQNN